MTYLSPWMCATYIILMGLPYWGWLVEWISLMDVLPNPWWQISFTDLGLSVNGCMGRPTRPTVAIPLVSTKFSWSRPSLSGLGQAFLVLVVSVKSRPGFLGLGQVDKVSSSWVGLGQGDQVSVSPIPVDLHSIYGHA